MKLQYSSDITSNLLFGLKHIMEQRSVCTDPLRFVTATKTFGRIEMNQIVNVIRQTEQTKLVVYGLISDLETCIDQTEIIVTREETILMLIALDIVININNYRYRQFLSQFERKNDTDFLFNTIDSMQNIMSINNKIRAKQHIMRGEIPYTFNIPEHPLEYDYNYD